MSSHIPADGHAIIIGAAKSGTTSLYHYLSEHPAICPASVKEPEFFSRSRRHGASVEHYDDLWDFDETVHRYALEASTGYTMYPSEPAVPEAIAEYGIRPKLIYIVRDPFERIESHFNFSVAKRHVHVRPDSWNPDILDPEFVDPSRYATQLDRYREVFPAESILLLDFDALRTDPDELLHRTHRFLGLALGHLPEKRDVRNRTRMPSELEARIRQSMLGRLLPLAPRWLVRAGRDALRRASVPKKRRLTDTEREHIRAELAADAARLKSVYGFAVQKWGFDETSA